MACTAAGATRVASKTIEEQGLQAKKRALMKIAHGGLLNTLYHSNVLSSNLLFF